VIQANPSNGMDRRVWPTPCRRWDIGHSFGRTVIEGIDFIGDRRPIRFRYTRRSPLLLGEVQRGQLDRGEVAAMIQANRRHRFNPSVIRDDDGVMRQCPRTGLDDWKRRH